ncbi:histone-lysine N-methyltransferase PRDM9 [Silurus meridionalis]|nr:histone-lysine N-methyltransferase PRDM9 [Silurus meridionalis]
MCTTSDGGTSSSEEFVNPVDLQTLVKKEEPEDEGYLCGDTSSPTICVISFDQQPRGFQRIAIKEEEPEDDEFLYCEHCRSSFTNKCEVHGPALYISDTPVPMGVTDRAIQTLPPSLEVRMSDIPGAGFGVFNKGETIPLGAHFGPFEGDLVDKEEAMNSGYSWVITRNMQCEKYIDGQREMHSNWMRYVNCARNEQEQNLVAFQYRGGILYRCCQPIKTGQELLMWYKDDYGKDLGLEFDYLWKKKCFSNGYVQP